MIMHNDWDQLFDQEIQKDYLLNLRYFLAKEYETKNIYPAKENIFAAFKTTSLKDTKVVILGQDPYHGPEQAHGLAFSVKPHVAIPPSLRNIYKELAEDIPGFVIPKHGDLRLWAHQGVLLLNTVLTVQAGKAHSHASWGWETFTDAVVAQLNAQREHLVFLLWGSHAQKKGQMIDRHKHLVLSSAHPSPLSAHRGFLGNRHFSQTNAYLQAQGLAAIDWQV